MQIVIKIVAFWAWLSAANIIIGYYVFIFWIIRRRIETQYMYEAIPGYLESVYKKWCQREGRSPKKVLVYRKISWISLVLSVLLSLIVIAIND